MREAAGGATLPAMYRFLPLLLLAAPAVAAERNLYVGSFERLRVDGPYRVTVTTGRSPGGRVSGEARQLDRVEVRLDGNTLVVRPPIDRWQDRPPEGATPIAVTLTTPTLTAATVIGGGAVTIAGGRTVRLDLTVTGNGSIALAGAAVDQANATVIGSGRIALAGRAAKARLLVNGPGRIEAESLDAGELVVRVDGPGEALASARFTATVTNIGVGRVTVAGSPKCVVKSDAGGPVVCGASAPR